MCVCAYDLCLCVPCPGHYTCSITLNPLTDQQVRVLSMSLSSLKVRAAVEGSAFSGQQAAVVLPLEPSLYSDKSELMLSNLHPSAELTIYGPTAALSSLEVGESIKSMINVRTNIELLNYLNQSCKDRKVCFETSDWGPVKTPSGLQVVSSSPSITVQETEAHRGFPSFSKYTVSAADPQAAVSASISISSATSEQTLIIPVALIHVADYSGTAASQGRCASLPGESSADTDLLRHCFLFVRVCFSLEFTSANQRSGIWFLPPSP